MATTTTAAPISAPLLPQMNWVLPLLSAGHPGRLNEAAFQSAIFRLKSDFELTPSVGSFIKTLRALPTDEKQALADRLDVAEPLTLDQQKQFAGGIRQVLIEDNGIKALRQTAAAGADAANDIEQQFADLRRELEVIDNDLKDGGVVRESYAEMLDRPMATFAGILKECKSFAMEISTYSARFAKVGIEFATDENLTTTERAKFIERYVKDAAKFQRKRASLVKQIDRLKTEVLQVLKRFEDFEQSGGSEQIKDDIAMVEKRLVELDQELGVLKAAVAGIAASTGLLGGLATGLAAIFPPAAPLTGTLESFPGWSLGPDFTESIKLILDVFQNVSEHAGKILDWLNEGGEAAARPESMLLSLKDARDVYIKMADYLEDLSEQL